MAIEEDAKGKARDVKREMREGSPDDVSRASRELGSSLVGKASGAMDRSHEKTGQARRGEGPVGETKEQLKDTAEKARGVIGAARTQVEDAKDAAKRGG